MDLGTGATVANGRAAPDLDALFSPRVAAIVGASPKLSYYVKGMLKFGFGFGAGADRQLLLVTPHHEELFGLPCHPSSAAAAGELRRVQGRTRGRERPVVDLLVLAVRRDVVHERLAEALDAFSVKFVHAFTAGLGETGEEGARLEARLAALAAANSCRLLGPNCMGVYSPEGHASYSHAFPSLEELERLAESRPGTPPVKLGLIFQSGDLHTKFVLHGWFRFGLRVAKGASIGNCADLQFSEFVRYFERDPGVDFTCAYLEGFPASHPSEGRAAFNALRSASKPVLLLRGGRSGMAQAAARTHTGVLGTNERAWRAVFQQTSAVEVGPSLEHLVDAAAFFQLYFQKVKAHPEADPPSLLPRTPNATVVIWSGGLGVLDVDALTQLGVQVPRFGPEAQDRLQATYPLKIGSLANPLDLPWIAGSDAFAQIVEATMEDQFPVRTDLVLVEADAPLNWSEERFEAFLGNLERIRGKANSTSRYFVVSLPDYPHPLRHRLHQRLVDHGFATFPSAARAGAAFLALFRWASRKRRVVDAAPRD